MAENVRSGSVAVVSGIYYSDTDDCRPTFKAYNSPM